MIHKLCKTVKQTSTSRRSVKKYIKLRSLLTVKHWRKIRDHQYSSITKARKTYFCRMIFKCYWCLNSGSSDLRKKSSKTQPQNNLHSLVFIPLTSSLITTVG